VTTTPGRRRLRPSRIAAAVLLLLPILEIVVLVMVGQAVGAWPTFLLLVATGVLGAWIIRREGGRAWRALNQAVQSGRMPARELADGMIILIGGTLLLLPGFVSDLVGLLLVLPLTRPAARRVLETVITHRLLAQEARFGKPPRRDGAVEGDVIEGEIVDE
jgi:UPF0716 protein FxsA